MKNEIAPKLPVMSVSDVAKIRKWFEDAITATRKIIDKNFAHDRKENTDKRLKPITIELTAFAKAGDNLVVVGVTKETPWAGGENIGKVYGRFSKTFHVQKVAEPDHSTGGVKSWSLQVTGSTTSETSYNGYVSTGTSSGGSGIGILDSKSLAKIKEKGLI